MTDTKDPEAPWWKAFPEARAKCPEITADDVMKLFDDMDITSEPRSFLLVDVRRNDWEVCQIYIVKGEHGKILCSYPYSSGRRVRNITVWVDAAADEATQGGTIKTSLNLPAQSFYQSRKTLLELCSRAGITKVIFYCGELFSS
jgi:arsenical-resistance protein 2